MTAGVVCPGTSNIFFLPGDSECHQIAARGVIGPDGLAPEIVAVVEKRLEKGGCTEVLGVRNFRRWNEARGRRFTVSGEFALQSGPGSSAAPGFELVKGENGNEEEGCRNGEAIEPADCLPERRFPMVKAICD